ncbi:hypothetical protein D9M71_64610 [compost metagenome]
MERIQRFVVGDADVLDTLHFVQVGVLRADARVVQAGGNRVGVGDLAVAVLQQVGAVAVQYARDAAGQACGVFVGIDAVAAGFNTDDVYAQVVEERVEQAHGIGAAANTGNQAVGQATFLGVQLLFGFLADDRLEVANHCRVRMRASHGANQVEGVVDVGNPVAQGFVHRIFQSAGTGSHRDDFSAQQLHAEHVGLLAFDVGGTHVDDARQAEARGHGGSGHAVHARAGFSDQALLAHALGQQYLADAVVHLVRAGVVQLFTLEVDLGAAAVFGQAFGEVQRVWTADVVALEIRQLLKKFRVVLGCFIFTGQVEHQRHQGFSHVAAAECAKQAIGIRAAAEIGLGHGTLQVR